MFILLKKIALYVIILLGIIYGYQYMTGKSITTLPRDVVNKFYEKGPAESTNPKYYKDPANSLPKD
jgi:hypothetical protein